MKPDPDSSTHRERRLKTFRPCVLEAAGSSRRVHVLNISKAGALVHGSGVAQAGVRVTLVCGSLRRSGRSAWVNGDRIGVAFNLPLEQGQLDAALELSPSEYSSTCLEALRQVGRACHG